MIKVHGHIPIPAGLHMMAEPIRFQNYKVNKIGKIQKHAYEREAAAWFFSKLSEITGYPAEKMDAVFFSACSGAEAHTDMLDHERFTDTTIVIPFILPNGDTVFSTRGQSIIFEMCQIYEFDHTYEHEMTVEDDKSGCVVLMIAIKK